MSDNDHMPKALLHNLKHNVILHERNVLLTVSFHDSPVVAPSGRFSVEDLGNDFHRVKMNFGYMEIPDVPKHLQMCARFGLEIDPFTTSYFINRQSIVSTSLDGAAGWREGLFALMYRNASSVVNYFHIPHNSVIELGIRVAI